MRVAGEEKASYREQEDIARVPRIMMRGTYWLHRDSKTHRLVLPPVEGEINEQGGDSIYMERVRRASIDPYFERAVERVSSSLFNKPMQLMDDVPVEISGSSGGTAESLWKNIDGKGNNGDEFFRRVAHDSISDRGMSGVLAEFPKTPEGATRADVDSFRPYLVHYRGSDILDGDVDYVLGRERVREVWLKETPRQGADEEHKRERQVSAPEVNAKGVPLGFVTYAVWEQKEAGNNESWVEIERGEMRPHTEIPFRVYYTGWRGFFKARTPFLQLAYRNLLHTKLESADIENLVISSGAQMYRGVLDEKELDQRAIGPRSVLYSVLTQTGPTPFIEWLERSGSASEMMRQKLESIESRMVSLSNEVHIKRTPGDETATGKAIDTAEAKTETEAWSMALRDFVQTVLTDVARYFGLESGGTVKVSPPPRYSERDVTSVEKAMEMRARGILHPEDGKALELILELAKEVFNWPESFSPEESAARNIQLGTLVPGGLERPAEALNRDVLTIDSGLPEDLTVA